jgi:hypothetical protein
MSLLRQVDEFWIFTQNSEISSQKFQVRKSRFWIFKPNSKRTIKSFKSGNKEATLHTHCLGITPKTAKQATLLAPCLEITRKKVIQAPCGESVRYSKPKHSNDA